MSDLAATAGHKRKSFTKVPPPEEPPPEPTEEPRPKRKARRPSEAQRLMEEARATADAERAQAAETFGAPSRRPRGPKLSPDDRRRLRRIQLRQIAGEVTISHGAKLDALAQHHGTQRAALEAAIDAAYSAMDR